MAADEARPAAPRGETRRRRGGAGGRTTPRGERGQAVRRTPEAGQGPQGPGGGNQDGLPDRQPTRYEPAPAPPTPPSSHTARHFNASRRPSGQTGQATAGHTRRQRQHRRRAHARTAGTPRQRRQAAGPGAGSSTGREQQQPDGARPAGDVSGRRANPARAARSGGSWRAGSGNARAARTVPKDLRAALALRGGSAGSGGPDGGPRPCPPRPAPHRFAGRIHPGSRVGRVSSSTDPSSARSSSVSSRRHRMPPVGVRACSS
jgi:hypothetical protein